MTLLALFTLLLLLSGRLRRVRPAPAPALEPAPTIELPADDLCELPRYVPSRSYSEKASSVEMTFAGHYLNLAGMLLLTLGALSSLHLSGRVSGGVGPSLLGLLVGGALLLSGHRLHRRGDARYAEPLLAGGGAISLLTLVGAHFHYGVLALPGLAVGLAALTLWSGWAMQAYDSRLIGNGTLAAMFLAPAGLHATLGQTLVYLVTINVATTVIAFRKRWDFYRIACFVGTYALFFHEVQGRPGITLAFLGATYLLFLLPDNLFRRPSTAFDLPLAFVNPLVFAVTSYAVMLHLPNAVPTVVNLAVGTLHLTFARSNWRRRADGPAFEDLATNNLVLGLLFLTSAVSFVPYFSPDTDYFWLTMALWFAEAIALVLLSHKSERYSAILRRAGLLCVGLASAQLCWVLVTVDGESWGLANLGAALGYFALYLALRPGRTRVEPGTVMVVSALATMTIGAELAIGSAHPMPWLGVVALLSLAWSVLEASVLGPVVALVAAAEVGIAALPWVYPGRRDAFELSLCLVAQLPLALRSSRWPERLAPLCVALAVVALVPALAASSITTATLVSASASLALCLACTRWPLLAPVAPLAATGALVSYVLAFGADSAAVQVWVAMACLLASFWTPRRESALALAVAMALRLSMTLSLGSPGTALWCGVALALLAAGRLEDGRAVLVLAFLKAILMDASFEASQTLTLTLSVSQLLGMIATVAAFALAARRCRAVIEERNRFTVLALTCAAFHSSLVLYVALGTLEQFQVLLSGFWLCTSVLLIAHGIWAEVKVFRLFGLALLCAAGLKVYVVDVWVLNAYSQVTTTLLLGAMLMMVSALYQTNRARLVPMPVAA